MELKVLARHSRVSARLLGKTVACKDAQAFRFIAMSELSAMEDIFLTSLKGDSVTMLPNETGEGDWSKCTICDLAYMRLYMDRES